MHAKQVLIALVLLFTVPGISLARDIRQGDQCVVESEVTVHGNLFVLCRSLVIDGRVEGNLLGAAVDAQINGVITGDVYLAAGQLNTHGSLGQDLHFVGAVLGIQPETQFADDRADLMSASLSTTVFEGARVPGTIIDLGYQLVVEGVVDNEVSFWGSALTVDGEINGDVDATVGDPTTNVSQLDSVLRQLFDVGVMSPGLRVTERGSIRGQLSYTGPVEGEIQGALLSEPQFTRVLVLPEIIQQDAPRVVSTYLSELVREFLSLAIVGLVGLLLAPRTLQASIRNLQSRPVPSLSVGLITFIVSLPFWLIILALIGLLILILLFLQLGGLIIAVSALLGLSFVLGASIFYFVAIYVTRVIVGLALGRALIRTWPGDANRLRVAYIQLLAGVALLAVMYSLPLIGWLLSAISAFLGLGALLLIIRGQVRVMRDAPGTRIRLLPRLREIPEIPLMVGDSTQPPGMDNLPEGFRWWEDDD
jgi:hypothetical protein